MLLHLVVRYMSSTFITLGAVLETLQEDMGRGTISAAFISGSLVYYSPPEHWSPPRPFHLGRLNAMPYMRGESGSGKQDQSICVQ